MHFSYGYAPKNEMNASLPSTTALLSTAASWSELTAQRVRAGRSRIQYEYQASHETFACICHGSPRLPGAIGDVVGHQHSIVAGRDVHLTPESGILGSKWVIGCQERHEPLPRGVFPVSISVMGLAGLLCGIDDFRSSPYDIRMVRSVEASKRTRRRLPTYQRRY